MTQLPGWLPVNRGCLFAAHPSCGTQHRLRTSSPNALRIAAVHCGRNYRVVAWCCTSRQRKARVTESRVVLYWWHPWYGRTVLSSEQYERVSKPSFAAREAIDVARPLEVPEWMFDAAACCRTKLGTAPCVSAEALLSSMRCSLPWLQKAAY